MKAKCIYKFLNELAPIELKMDFDNVGLLVGDPNAEVKSCLVALDITDAVIDEVLRNGDADIGRDYVETIRAVAAGYAAEIMRRLREHEYDPQTMRLWVVGGGGCLLRHFGEYERDRVTIIDNIHANAEGYEYLAERRLMRERFAE